MAGKRTAPDEALGPLQRWRSCAALTLSAAMLASKTRATSRFARAKTADGGEFCAAQPAKPSFLKNTALFRSTMAPSRITAVAASFKEGCRIRKTARLTGAATRRALVHGTLTDAAAHSSNSGQINTAFVERQSGADRTYNCRKRRKTYEFSKDLVVHTAVTWGRGMLCYNFHPTNRGLRLKLADDSFVYRSPTVAAGLADVLLSITDIFTL